MEPVRSPPSPPHPGRILMGFTPGVDWRQAWVGPVVSVWLGSRDCFRGHIWMHCQLSVDRIKEATCGSHVLMCRNSWKILENKLDKRKSALPDFIMHSEINK